jgi:hypothetical protein
MLFCKVLPEQNKRTHKLPAEKPHQKFCKYILGVHSKTSNTAVLSELGRFPIYFNIVKALVKYHYRLKNIQSDFPDSVTIGLLRI